MPGQVIGNYDSHEIVKYTITVLTHCGGKLLVLSKHLSIWFEEKGEKHSHWTFTVLRGCILMSLMIVAMRFIFVVLSEMSRQLLDGLP